MHQDTVTVIGLGTQDSLEEARQFRTERGVTFKLLWDASGESWRHMGIRGQPAAVLFDGRGRELKRWFGNFAPDEVLALSRNAEAQGL